MGNEQFLEQHVCTPTRPESNTILDLIFSSVDTPVDGLEVKECFGAPDHSIITFHVSIPSVISETTTKKFPLFSKGKWHQYREMLMGSYWPESSSLGIDELWEIYRSNILKAAHASIPQVTKRDWKPQNSSKVRTAIRRHRRLCRSLREDNSLSSKLRLQSSITSLNKVVFCETYKHELRVSKTLYSDPRPFWCYVKSKTQLRDTISVIKNSKGECVSDPQSVADCFSSHFASVFQSSAHTSVPLLSSSPSTTCRIDTISFPLLQVIQCIKRLPSSTSADPEGLCYELVKRGGMFLASKLSYFFGRSMEAAYLPKSWKLAKITPVYKSGPRDQCSNYRPIALTSCISRIMERIISSQMLREFRSNHVICSSQHGFLPGRSIETAGVQFLDAITCALDNNKCIDAVFLDYSKAFDTVPHELLISKLANYGVAGCLLQWISDYLHDRHHYVCIKKETSKSVPITSGVIQGSVLGPLLFIIFINGVDSCVTRSSVIKYADDIKLFTSFPSEYASQLAASEELQADMKHLYDWSTKNGLSLNLSKCKVMHFGTSNVQNPVHLNGAALDAVNTIKDLGVFLTSSCTFSYHVSHIVSRSNKALGLIKRVFLSRDKNVLLPLYKARVRSILEYGSILWDPYRHFLSEAIEKVQRRFTRIFPYLRGLSYRERLSHLKLLSLSARRLRYKLIFLYKIVNNHVDVDPDVYFSFATYTSTRGNPVKIIPPFSRRDCRRHFFSVDTVFHWNSMYKHEVDVHTVTAFKKSIVKYFDRNGIW